MLYWRRYFVRFGVPCLPLLLCPWLLLPIAIGYKIRVKNKQEKGRAATRPFCYIVGNFVRFTTYL